VKLAGLVSEGSGAHNEDSAGVIERDGEIVATWVFDGVTGINDSNYLDASSDAVWLVQRAEVHLRRLAAQDTPLNEILRLLVDCLIVDWQTATDGLSLPEGYDIPATCLLLAKRDSTGWKALRLGDSFLLSQTATVHNWQSPETDLGGLEALLRREAKQQRAKGVADFKALLQRFHPQLIASRRARNSVGNHSILVPDQSSLVIPEYIDLGWPASLLLCSDGLYRAVDTYGMMDDAALLSSCASPGGVEKVLRQIRAIEADDPGCEKYLRFKPADDASAVCLVAR
jgi:serine/threonine protein phosphatase PrpC